MTLSLLCFHFELVKFSLLKGFSSVCLKFSWCLPLLFDTVGIYCLSLHVCEYQWRTQDFADVYAHFALYVYFDGMGVGMGVGGGGGGGTSLPQPHKEQKDMEVYALRFVHTSSYPTDYS